MPERSPQTVVGDTTTVALPKGDRGNAVAMAVSSAGGGAAAYTGVVEVSFDDGTTYLTPVKFVDPTAGETGTLLASIGLGGGGWFRCPGATHVRVRCTAFTTPGNGANVRLNPVYL